jgi:hypothetical protein
LGVTAVEALEVVGSVWLYAQDNPRDLPDDLRLTYALGSQLFKTRPTDARILVVHGKTVRRYPAPPGIARREVGEALRVTLGTFFARVTQALDEEFAQQREQALTLAQPFTPTLGTP